MDKKVIQDAVEMTKNISANDILVPLQLEESELTPYPKVEYDVIMHYKLDKLIKDVNKKLEQGWQTKGGIQVSNGASVMYYQTLIRRNVDCGPEPEMPSENSKAGCQGPELLHMPGLENEPDLYEDIEKDETNGNSVAG